MTLLSKLDRTPPLVFRLMARVKMGHLHYRMMPLEDIARKAEISLSTVCAILKSNSWAGRMDCYDRFVIACGWNPLRPSDALSALKRICRRPKGLASAKHLGPRQLQQLQQLLKGT